MSFGIMLPDLNTMYSTLVASEKADYGSDSNPNMQVMYIPEDTFCVPMSKGVILQKTDGQLRTNMRFGQPLDIKMEDADWGGLPSKEWLLEVLMGHVEVVNDFVREHGLIAICRLVHDFDLEGNQRWTVVGFLK